MTTMTVPARDAHIDASDREDLAALTRSLLLAQAEAAALVAELTERATGWSRALPVVAELVRSTRCAADHIDGRTTHAVTALDVDAPVTAVVWARELGAAQRRLARALGGVRDGRLGNERTVDILTVSAVEMRALTGQLTALTAAAA